MSKVIKGTPTPLFIQSRQWSWEQVSGPHTIDLPLGENIEGAEAKSVEFDLDADLDVRLNFGDVIKLMYTHSVYPALKEGEVFSVSDILVDKGGGVLTLVGNVIKQVD